MSSTRRESNARPLTIIELCLSQGRGGLEHYAADLVPDLSQRGHRVIVVTRKGTDFSTRTGRAPALTLRPHGHLRWVGARRLGALIKDSLADVIHIHRSADLPLAVMAKRCAGDHPALVYSRHMLISRDRRGSWPHRFMFQRVDRLLPITAGMGEEARRKLPIAPERVRPLVPGVLPAQTAADCAEIRPPDTDFVVGCFSRVEPAKGQLELIEAVAALRQQGIRAGGVFAGSVMNPAYDKRLHDRVEELALDNAVRFLGTLKDARPVMPCCDAIAMPSTGEALGLVLVESMLMGVPVVGSAAGGVLEFIRNGETGLTYPVGDSEALTGQLKKLATDRDLARALGRAGRRAATEQFDRETHLDRLEAIFHEAVAERADKR
ncbi:MAG: glycosyltransferase family 4 protein [Gammaproteobacteria bacterium]|nr:glycosyltransferase family 4 protein [Gammaproteobacteria bacterium]